MSILFGPIFSKKVIKYRNNKSLYTKINKCLELFEKSPQHPSLRFHKLSFKDKNLFSISVNKSIRILCMFDHNDWYMVDIGTHEQVYKDK